mgnify:CR=1 FL=1
MHMFKAASLAAVVIAVLSFVAVPPAWADYLFQSSGTSGALA